MTADDVSTEIGKWDPQVNDAAEFGDAADPGIVDAHVRAVMQAALRGLAAKRRFPVVG